MKNELDIRDEEILLLGLCRMKFSDEQAVKLSKLAGKVSDWDHFTWLASEHGIAALVYRNMEMLDLIRFLPEEYFAELRNAQLLSLSRNAFHLSAAEEIAGILRREGISIVLLKGLALELTVYGNQGLRQMTDIDILIDRKKYIAVRNILMGNGYDSLPVKSGFHKPIIEWTGKHLPSLMKNGASVDIHLELFAGRRNNLTKILLENSGEIRLEREVAAIPPPRLLFLYLIRHLYYHEMNNESQLRLYADLVVLLENYRDEIITYELLGDALKAGLSNILAWKLEPLRDLWGLSFPGWINDFIDRGFNPDSINKFVFFLKSPKNNSPEFPGRVYRRTLKEIPGLHRKMLFLLGDLFPTLSFMKERYGAGSTFRAILYYPLRLGKLAWLIRR
jgi:hypothetical protein